MNAILEVEDLTVRFPVGRNVFGRPRGILTAVDHVSLSVPRHQTVGLVGESGSGKSTLGRAALRLIPSQSGTIAFDGLDISGLGTRALRALRPRMHLIFQDPYSSLDPSWEVEDLVAEPLGTVDPPTDRRQRRALVIEALERVGLSATHLNRYASQFSGGQRQRLAIARALVTRPDLIVCDEAVSALDVSTRSQIINLLADLQKSFGMTYLFIAHDLALVRHISDRIAVMYLGAIVEEGPAQRVYEEPAHPYTRSLLSAIPRLDPAERQQERIVLSGELPSPLALPSGCRFRTRCPHAMPICAEVTPPVVAAPGGGWAACHLNVQSGSTPISVPANTDTPGRMSAAAPTND